MTISLWSQKKNGWRVKWLRGKFCSPEIIPYASRWIPQYKSLEIRRPQSVDGWGPDAKMMNCCIWRPPPISFSFKISKELVSAPSANESGRGLVTIAEMLICLGTFGMQLNMGWAAQKLWQPHFMSNSPQKRQSFTPRHTICIHYASPRVNTMQFLMIVASCTATTLIYNSQFDWIKGHLYEYFSLVNWYLEWDIKEQKWLNIFERRRFVWKQAKEKSYYVLVNSVRQM